jgi:hypothetical protein
MLQNAFRNLDPRKWIDRMHPQTLSIGTFLLYIDGIFALLRFFDRNDVEGYLRMDGGLNAFLTFGFIICYPLGGFLMANGKLLGWYLAIIASFSPFVIRAMFKVSLADMYSWRNVVTGGDLVNLMFEVALCALLLHPMSQSYAKKWLR